MAHGIYVVPQPQQCFSQQQSSQRRGMFLLPVPGSTKARLALIALHEFGRRGYDRVAVADLCAKGA